MHAWRTVLLTELWSVTFGTGSLGELSEMNVLQVTTIKNSKSFGGSTKKALDCEPSWLWLVGVMCYAGGSITDKYPIFVAFLNALLAT